jgi:hypothetical protein
MSILAATVMILNLIPIPIPTAVPVFKLEGPVGFVNVVPADKDTVRCGSVQQIHHASLRN